MKNIVKKIGKWIAIALGAFIVIALVAGLIIHDPLPEGVEGQEADALAHQMLEAINDSAWRLTGVIAWTFPGGHHYIWDRERHWVEVKWDKNRVLLKIDPKTGKVWQDGEEITDTAKKSSLLNQAWEYWVNDSFWLNAPAKVFDPGTKRSLVTLENGDKALLVTYEQGGDTPGDSYLWLLDENYLPISWKLWVNIIPIGGIAFTWEDWKTIQTGAKIATLHKSGPFSLRIQDIKGATNIGDFMEGEDPFQQL